LHSCWPPCPSPPAPPATAPPGPPSRAGAPWRQARRRRAARKGHAREESRRHEQTHARDCLCARKTLRSPGGRRTWQNAEAVLHRPAAQFGVSRCHGPDEVISGSGS
jgi:hypothetical protein